MSLGPLARVAVVGTSCAGKSTLARALAAGINLPYFELDASYWGPNWTPVDARVFRRRVDELTSQPRWVCDGSYSMVRELIWTRADTVVWLNYSFPLVFARALRRTFKRCFTKTQLFTGNRESFRMSFLSRDSILLWVLRTHWARQREYPMTFAEPQHSHLQVVQLRTRLDSQRFLAEACRVTDGRSMPMGNRVDPLSVS
jgi:adenylate kinase family enzyme